VWLKTQGLFGVWNTSTISAYSVLAETEADFVATVKFAAVHNLRLVVKATGHDWYGRSTAAGSLLLWTHKRKQITWHNLFPSPESAGGVPAVTVETGVQFSDLYVTLLHLFIFEHRHRVVSFQVF
jgi:FAD/FMN-containing dehydrogenase